MFLIGVNDIADCIVHAMVLLFADDIKLAMAISTVSDTRFLQADINNALQWSERNRLPFNLVKCEVITITRRQEPYIVEYFLGGHVVERKNEIRDLGILVDPSFQFVAHRERIITKARQSMGYIKMISKGQFNTRALVVLYTSYVRSKLEFGSVIWDPYQENYSDDIESVQKQFVLYALGDTNRIPPYRLSPYEERCEKLGLDRLSTRRKEANIMTAYDLYNKRINDRNVESRFIRRSTHYQLTSNRVLTEARYGNDYGHNQPLAKMIRLVNEHEKFLSLRRIEFKAEAKKKLKKKLKESIT